MKLLHINITYSSGSTGSIIKNINTLFKEKYPESEVYTAFVQGAPDKNGFKFLNNFEFFIIRAFRKLFGRTLFGTFFPTKRLIRYIKKLNPDIIHLHTLHHQTLNYKLLFKYLCSFKGKVFYTLHDCWPFTGGCYYYSEFGCNKFLTECDKCLQNKNDIDCKRNYVKKEFAFKKKTLLSIPDITFVAVSDWLAGEAKKSFLKEKEIITVHNGINADIFKPLSLEKNEKFTVISVATYWSPRKHLDILLELSKELKDINFIVVGQLSESIDCSQYPNVEFVGRTSNAGELCELYNKADVFANFSTEETFGLVTAEAMACGLPVIAFNKTACGEIVESDCGFVVDDVASYKKALLQLKNRELACYLETCRKKVLTLYTKEIMAQSYIDLYSQYFDSKI